MADNRMRQNWKNPQGGQGYPQTEIHRRLRPADVLHAVRKHLVLIAICSLVGLILGVVLSVVSYMNGQMRRQYAIKTSIAVTSQNESGLFTSQLNNPDSSDVHLAESMVDSVMYVLESDATLSNVIKKLDLIGISNHDIASNLSMHQYNLTQIIEITLYWRSAEEGVAILNALNDTAANVLIETLKIGNVSVINKPAAKYLIGGNINASLWGYMAILGIFMGIGFSLLQLLIAPTLLNPKDMEQMFGVELLGEVPERKNYFKKKRNLLQPGREDSVSTEVMDNYASLAHIIHNRIRGREHSCIYVTSSIQNEGKTSSTAYLGMALADIGLKVLLIDLDTRNPVLGSMFLNKVTYEHSLNAYYRGDCVREDAITNLAPRLDLLPAVLEKDSIPLDDTLFGLVRDLQQMYDVVLLDTAPIGLVADTMGLTRLADQALLIVRFDNAKLEIIRAAIERLEKSGVTLIGCMVNCIREFRKNNNGYYYRSYGHYGRKHSKGSNTNSRLQKEWDEWEKKGDAAEILERRNREHDFDEVSKLISKMSRSRGSDEED